MPNRLVDEVSPYLRQHKDNPVHWFPWCDEAFAEARQRNVPILLSVGYSACHWCHVMAHECFEDNEVADVMNADFVSIKVDREERPDVDAVYMEAVQALTGRGGWPMTVFMTPDAKPFFGGTYFPKPTFMQLMAAITDAWTTKREDINSNVDALMQALKRSELAEPSSTVAPLSVVNAASEQLHRAFDSVHGGFGAAPKFPSTMNLDLLLLSGTKPIAPVLNSLDAMASGGIYDHLAGGFARYSVDQEWLTPHFEKMLYDQALLVRLYVHGALVTGDLRYRQVVEETINYVLGSLTHPDGGFYSAEDADSNDNHGHSHEGWFYTWSMDELRSALPHHLLSAAVSWYGATEEGNFEGRNILSRLHARGDIIRSAELEQVRQMLCDARLLRHRPLLDDKVLTEWNGYMLSALCEAAFHFNNSTWLQAAISNGEFLVRELRTSTGAWHRSWHQDGTPRARHFALSADLASLVDAFTRLGEASGERRWLHHATDIANQLLDNYWDADRGGVYTTAHNGEQLVARQKDLLDNATPSANSTTALALYRLAALTGEARYENHADRIMQLLDKTMRTTPSAAGHALSALFLRQTGITEVVIPGNIDEDSTRNYLEVLRGTWRPNVAIAWGEADNSPLWTGRTVGNAYVCERSVCMAPVSTPEDLRRALDVL